MTGNFDEPSPNIRIRLPRLVPVRRVGNFASRENVMGMETVYLRERDFTALIVPFCFSSAAPVFATIRLQDCSRINLVYGCAHVLLGRSLKVRDFLGF